MKVVVIACIHNDVESIINFSDRLAELNFDVIVCPGDFLDAPIKKIDSLELGKLIVSALKTFDKPLLVVPGCWDKVLINFFEKEGISILGKGVVVDNVGFYGFGGAKTPFNLPYEPSEEEIKTGLEKGWNDVKDCKYKIQVTHAPPLDTKLDIITIGAHVGSSSVREFIEKHQPTTAICCHIHEARNVDVIGKTKIINPGRFPEGYCGFITIEKDLVDVKLINLT